MGEGGRRFSCCSSSSSSRCFPDINVRNYISRLEEEEEALMANFFLGGMECMERWALKRRSKAQEAFPLWS